MKVKYDNKIIDIENASITSRKEFYAEWNFYIIHITKERLKTYGKDYGSAWYIQLITPRGGYDYDGYYKKNGSYAGTLNEALQDCFNNVDYPPMTLCDEEDE